jgi:alkylation response protein AidB-like acyl-CoA dehydrogenase
MANLVGEEGKGIREILSHAHLTRLDFAIGSAGLMRQALTLALRHTPTRNAFATSIAERPMMTNVLADMAVEVEAATLRALRVARATDDLGSVEQERLLARVATPAAKFYNCSRAPSIAYEALQCHGGNGFIEENRWRAFTVRLRLTASGRARRTWMRAAPCVTARRTWLMFFWAAEARARPAHGARTTEPSLRASAAPQRGASFSEPLSIDTQKPRPGQTVWIFSI